MGYVRTYAYIHEIIPIDDNSTDRTREVIESLTKDEPRMKTCVSHWA